MASTATPMGAEPVGTLSASGSFTGKVRHIKIASGYGTAIFYGDFVKIHTDGTVQKDTGTATLTPCGVFVGCAYTDPSTNQKTFNQQFPASTAASDIVAYVVDDPNLLMQMQADGSLAQSALGTNLAVVAGAGSTSIGRSKNSTNSTPATTAGLPLRLIDFVDGPNSAVGDSFTDIIVKFNAGHQYDNTTGIG